MINAIIGSKIEQSQEFTPEGVRIPVTRILAGPCHVTAVNTSDKTGYTSVQLGFGTRKLKRVSQALLGHYKKSGRHETPPRFLREVRIENDEALTVVNVKVGDVIGIADVFKAGDIITVSGTSKGKGFQGGVRRHHFKGGPRTHGQSDRERAPGSIGQTTTPGRVYKGKRMAGRMGNDTVTLAGLSVVSIDGEKNILTIKGLVPGGRNSILMIKKVN